MNEIRKELIYSHVEVCCPLLIPFELREETWGSFGLNDLTGQYFQFGFTTPDVDGRFYFSPALIDRQTATLSDEHLLTYLKYWEARLNIFFEHFSLDPALAEEWVKNDLPKRIDTIDRAIAEQICLNIMETS